MPQKILTDKGCLSRRENFEDSFSRATHCAFFLASFSLTLIVTIILNKFLGLCQENRFIVSCQTILIARNLSYIFISRPFVGYLRYCSHVFRVFFINTKTNLQCYLFMVSSQSIFFSLASSLHIYKSTLRPCIK